MGSGAYGLAVGRSLGVDAFPLVAVQESPRKAAASSSRSRLPSFSRVAASASACSAVAPLPAALPRAGSPKCCWAIPARQACRRQAKLSRFSECLLFSDFLEPVDVTTERLETIAAQGVRGHLVQVLDPAEETLPYVGRTEFAASEGRDRVIAGRAETLREQYQDRLKRHRRELVGN